MANPIVNHLTGVAARYLAGSAIDRLEGRFRRHVEERHRLPGTKELLEEIDLTHLQTQVPSAALSAAPTGTGFAAEPAVALAEEVRAAEADAEPSSRSGLPPDLFNSVIGHETEKRVLTAALRSHRRLNVLLIGDPGTGKGALLDEVARVPGTRVVGGGDVTAAGLRGAVSDPETRVLVIDEIDRLRPEAVGTLRRLLQGNLDVATHSEQRAESHGVRFVAACNDANRLDPAIRDRFVQLRMRSLAPDERRLFLTEYLVRRRHLPHDQAAEVAELVAPRSASVRAADQLATLWQQDPDLAITMAARLGGGE